MSCQQFLHPALQRVVLESCPRPESCGAVIINGDIYPIKDGLVDPPLPNIDKQDALDLLLDWVCDGVCSVQDIESLGVLIKNYDVNVAFAVRCGVREVDRRNIADLLFGDWWLAVRQSSVDNAAYVPYEE